MKTQDLQEQLTKALEALVASPHPCAFVIVTNVALGCFIQFAIMDKALMFDLPTLDMSVAARGRAGRLFRKRGVDPEQRPLFDGPDGVAVDVMETFSGALKDVADGVALALEVFTEVFDVPNNSRFAFEAHP